MENVSKKWADNQKQLLVSESQVEITYEIADFDASDHDSATSSNQEVFSNVEQIVDGTEKDFVPYATLELHNWILDGSRKHLPNEAPYGDTGYVSNYLTNGYYTFENKPVVELDFTVVEPKVLPAITITWSKTYDEYATDFVVEFYKNSTLLKEERVLNKNVETIVKAEVKDYNKIRITINRWCLPFHRARIEEVFIGIRNKYTKKELFSLEQKQNVDSISGKLPYNEIVFSVDNIDNRYGEDGLYRHILQKQRIQVRYGYTFDGKTEWVNGGEYFLSYWEVPKGGLYAKFKGVGILDFLTNIYYKGKFQHKSFYDLAVEVLENADLPLKNGQKRWKLNDRLKSIYTDNPLKVATERECLQMIANACRCVLYTDKDGYICIEPISFEPSETLPSYEVNDFNSYEYVKESYIPVLKQVDTYYYNYFEGDMQEVYKADTVVQGTQELWITYERSAKEVTASITGGKILTKEFYANACRLTVKADGTVTITLTGKVMKEVSNRFSLSVSEQGETQEVRNPLISDRQNAELLAQHVKGFLSNRKKVEMNWRYNPILSAKDKITQVYKEDKQEVLLSELKSSYNGGFRATGKGTVLKNNGLD